MGCVWIRFSQVILNGDGEIIKIDISQETLKEEKTILEDLISAHDNTKNKLKSKTSEEISKAALNIPGLNFHFNYMQSINEIDEL